MPVSLIFFLAVEHCVPTVSLVAFDLVRLVVLAVHSRRSLAAENLFLRKQLALFEERKVKPRRADDSTRWMMATLSRMFPWRDALVHVKPDTLIRWHRKGFRLFWCWKSKPSGRPRLPRDLRQLINRWPSRIRLGARNANFPQYGAIRECRVSAEFVGDGNWAPVEFSITT
jgi:hypothetical protein